MSTPVLKDVCSAKALNLIHAYNQTNPNKKDLLSNSKGESFCPRLFGLITCDHAIKDTSFEGADMRSTIDYMLSILLKESAALKEIGIDTQPFIDNFALLEVIGNDTIKRKDQSIQEILAKAERVAKVTEQLEVGSKFLIPGGWMDDKDSGHALVYEVKKEANGKFSFSIYNTGAGLDYHAGIEDGNKAKYRDCLTISEADPAVITSPSFYRSLFEIEVLNQFKSLSEEKIDGATALYEGILKTLKGKETIADRDKLSFRTGQRSGSCSWKVLMTILRSHCKTYAQYRKLKYLVWKHAFHDMVQTLEQKGEAYSSKEKDSIQHLIKIASQKFARSINKSFDKADITLGERDLGLESIGALRKHLTCQKRSNDFVTNVEKSCDNPVFAIDPVKEGAQLPNSAFDPIPDFDLSNIDRIEEEFEKIVRYAEHIASNEISHATYVPRLVNKLVLKLLDMPIPTSGVDEWDKIPQDLIQKVLSQLMVLARMIYEGEQNSLGKRFIAYCHVFSVISKLVKKSSQSKLPHTSFTMWSLDSIGDHIQMGLMADQWQSYKNNIASSGLFKDKVEEDLDPFNSLYRFSKSADSKGVEIQLNGSFFASAEGKYIRTLLNDSDIVSRLVKHGQKTEEQQVVALLQDDFSYIPKEDGMVKEAYWYLLSFFGRSNRSCSRPFHAPRMMCDIKKVPFSRDSYEFHITDWTQGSPPTLPFGFPEVHSKSFLLKGRGKISDLEGFLCGSSESFAEIVKRYQKGLMPEDKRMESVIYLQTSNSIKNDEHWRVAAFIEREFPSIFDDKKIESFLISYLYRAQMKKVLENEPLFVLKTIETYQKYYEYFLAQGEVEKAAFILYYLKTFEGRYIEAKGTNEPFKNIDYIEKIQVLIKASKDIKTQSKVHVMKALMHCPLALLGKEPLSKQIAKDLIVAAYFQRKRIPDAQERRRDSEPQACIDQQSLTSLFHIYEKDLRLFFGNMTSLEVTAFLNEIASEIKLPICEKWEGTYPLFFNGDLGYEVDTGRYGTHSLSYEMAQDYMKKIGIEEDLFLHDNFYYTKDKDIRISSDTTPVKLQKKIEGNWCTYRDDIEYLIKDIKELQSLGNIKHIYFNEETRVHYIYTDKGDLFYHDSGRIHKIVNGQTFHLLYNQWLCDLKQQDLPLLKETAFLKRSLIFENKENGRKRLEIGKGEYVFETDEKGKYCFLNDPDYFWNESDPLLFSGHTSYIHLVSKTGRQSKIMVFPIETWKKQEDKKGTVGDFFPATVDDSKIYIYHLDKSGEPIITNTNDCALFAMIALSRRDYKKASIWLERSEKLGKYDSSSAEVLFEMLKCPDNHPDALNCKLRVYALLFQNNILHDNSDLFQDDLSSDFPSLYTQYLDSYAKGALKPLPSHLEKILLLKLSGIQSPLLARRKEAVEKGQGSFPIVPRRLKPEMPSVKDRRYTDYEIKGFVEGLQLPILPGFSLYKSKEKMPYFGVRKDDFEAHFISFYQDIQSGQGLQHLVRLECMRGEKDLDVRYLAWILEMVYHHPYRFPSIPVKDYKDRSTNAELKKLLTEIVRIAYDNRNQSVEVRKQKPIGIDSYKKAIKDDTHPHKNNTSHLHETIKIELKLNLQPLELFDQPFREVNSQTIEQLEEKRKDLKPRLEALEKEVLGIASKIPQNSHLANTIRLKRLSGEEKELAIEDLVGFFILGDAKSYIEETYLSQREITDLDHLIGKYLQVKKLLSQMENARDLYKEWEGSANEEREHLANRLLNTINSKSLYDPCKNREFLAFEAITGMLLHQGQVDNLSLLEDKQYVILHMLMGAGKSKVITPIWALMKARGDKLPIVIVPFSLYPTGKEEAKETVFKSFGKHAHAFEFERASDFSKKKLEALRNALQQWNTEKGFIYATRASVLSFLLKANELFYEYKELPSYETQERVQIAWDIIYYLQEHTVALFDEAHSILHCRDELNFTFGKKITASKDHADFIYSLIEEMVLDPELIKVIGLRSNRQALMSEIEYAEKVKPQLVRILSERFKIEEGYFNETIENVPDEVKSHPEKELIALGKELVTRLFPSTLKRKGDEHYGLKEGISYAIPYLGNNTPNKQAEFASPFETMLYSAYHYLQKGISLKEFQDFIDQLKIRAKEEIHIAPKSAKETSPAKLFKEMFGHELFQELDLERLLIKINQSPKTILAYVKEAVVQSIEIFPKKLGANPQHLVGMFKESYGMTGTPWNKDSYPSQFEVALDDGVDIKSEKIISSITDKNRIVLKSDHDDAILEELVSLCAKEEYLALIDVGALIKNRSNQEVASKLLMAADPIKIDGVVYYDANDQLCVMERTGQSIPFALSHIPKERRITFYDQRHTVGTDVKQTYDAKGLVTVSETLKRYELFQAQWRLREIDRSQSISVVITQRVKDLLPQERQEVGSQILEFVTRNQDKQERLDNFRSRKLEIKGIVQNAIYEALAGAKTFEKRYEIFKKTEDLMSELLDRSLFSMFGAINKEKPAQEILADYTNKWTTCLLTLKNKGVLQDSQKYIDKIENLRGVPLNPTYPASSNFLEDTQIEINREAQVETELEVHIDTELQRFRGEIQTRYEFKWVDMELFKAPWNPNPYHKDVFEDIDNNVAYPSSYRVDQALIGTHPVYIAGDVMAHIEDPKIQQMKSAFDENFMISYNFLQTDPFSLWSKPIYHLVVIEEADRSIKTIVIAQNELEAFKKELVSDTGTSDRKICIYDPLLGIVMEGKKTFDEKKLKSHPTFLKHLIYAKFLSGLSRYDNKEVPILREWIKAQGSEKMLDFYKKIIAYKEDSRVRFKGSQLERIFTGVDKDKDLPIDPPHEESKQKKLEVPRQNPVNSPSPIPPVISETPKASTVKSSDIKAPAPADAPKTDAKTSEEKAKPVEKTLFARVSQFFGWLYSSFSKMISWFFSFFPKISK